MCPPPYAAVLRGRAAVEAVLLGYLLPEHAHDRASNLAAALQLGDVDVYTAAYAALSPSGAHASVDDERREQAATEVTIAWTGHVQPCTRECASEG